MVLWALGDIWSSKCPNASRKTLRSLDDRLQVEVYILESPQHIDLLEKEFRVKEKWNRGLSLRRCHLHESSD